MISKRSLQNMQGQVRVNETLGYLFEDNAIKFAYRTSNGIVVDEFSTLDRMRLRRDRNRLSGYDLSGKTSENGYNIDVPNLPVLKHPVTRESLKEFDRQVVLNGHTLAVVIDGKVLYRGVEASYILGELTGKSFEEVMEDRVFVPPENRTPSSINPCIYVVEFDEPFDDPKAEEIVKDFKRKLEKISGIPESEVPDSAFQSFEYPGGARYKEFDKILRRNGIHTTDV